MNQDVSILEGKTLSSVIAKDDEITFTTVDGEVYYMYHSPECCEYVSIEDICGDLDDLVGSPITFAAEKTQDDPEPQDGIGMWTFYSFATNKGWVDIRWYGSSNGYYSVGVSFELHQEN